MESSVTKPLEEAINTIEGIDELRSVTSEGLSNILVFFNLERNREAAAQDVRDKVSTVLSQLPRRHRSAGGRRSSTSRARRSSASSSSGNRDLREITEIAKKQIKEDIETQRGVGSVSLIGGLERAINIILDTDQLVAYGLSIEQVKAAHAGAEHRDSRRPRRPGQEGADPAHDGPRRARRGFPRPHRRHARRAGR